MVRNPSPSRPTRCSLAQRSALDKNVLRHSRNLQRKTAAADYRLGFPLPGTGRAKKSCRNFGHLHPHHRTGTQGTSRRERVSDHWAGAKSRCRTQKERRTRLHNRNRPAGNCRGTQGRESRKTRCLGWAKSGEITSGTKIARTRCFQEHHPSTAKKNRISLFGNRKSFSGPPHPDRDIQFRQIADARAEFLAAGLPVISVDTKKKELIGNFANRGQTWAAEPIKVNAHDFPSDAKCRAAPYGVYDLTRNTGFVFVGTSSDTPEFAVAALREWWLRNREHYPEAKRILILADSGGSNSCRSRMFKKMLQETLADEFGLAVKVCHYPRGASKWNPVEHRLFSPISGNWAGVPLVSLKLLLGFIRKTTTAAGLRVNALLCRKKYRKGKKVSDREMSELLISRPEICPQWNYTIHPRIVSRN